MTEKPFKILSIDGGGIRGVFPAMLLANYEAELKSKGIENWQVYQNFDLICGTSTGGIMAIALSLGIPAQEIYNLYLENAELIFGGKRHWSRQLFVSGHNRDALERLVRKKFRDVKGNDEDPRLADCKTPVMVTIYDLLEGRPSVLKSKYHPAFVRDYHIPAYQAAMATSAAPTYFDPYTGNYTSLNNVEQQSHNKIDGGVFANNPTLNGIVEAQKAFDVKLENLAILSLGTGHQRFSDAGIKTNTGILKSLGLKKKTSIRKRFGIWYWMMADKKKRLIDIFMQGQTQQVQNLISLLKNGIDRREPDNFIYLRIDTQLDDNCKIEMDEKDKAKIKKLAEKATIEFQNNATAILNNFGTGNRIKHEAN
jgi:patatin-like phospholipase/acyl hydrolase